MKQFVLLVMGLLFLVSCTSAYSVMIDAPGSLAVGKPLIVTGTTTFGIGTPIDVVLYRQLTTATEIQRNVVYIQADRTFTTVFDTTGLQTGTYKVEVPANTGGDAPWYIIDSGQMPFICQALLAPKPRSVPAHGEFALRYRISVSPRAWTQAELENGQKEWLKTK